MEWVLLGCDVLGRGGAGSFLALPSGDDLKGPIGRVDCDDDG
jgi:hypothetical protein